MSHTWQMLPVLWQTDIIGAAEQPADLVISCSGLSALEVVIDRPLHVLFPFADTDWLPDMGLAEEVAAMGFWMINKGRKVVVNCDAGCNRSGLIIGMILRQCSVPNVVEYIQARHPQALYNQTFANYLKGNS